MSLPTSGSFGLTQIQTVFGGADPIGLTEYYRGGLYVANKSALANIPTAGQIKFTDFYGLGPNTSFLFNNGVQTRIDPTDDSSIYFGESMSMNYNATVLAVGAPGYDENSLNSGIVYIFTRTVGGTWAQQTTLRSSDGVTGTSENFGNSVSIDSNGNTLAVSAYLSDISGSIQNNGAVHIFTRTDGGTWTWQTRLNASDRSASDQFGYSVAINSDGTTLAVGAPYDDLTTPATGTDGGSVYIFTRTAGGTWAQQTRIQSSDASTSDHFGWSVGINSDGTTIVAGAPLHNGTAGADAGSIYIFTRTAGGTWAQQTTFQGAAASDQLGYSVAINSDATVAIAGAPYVDVGARNDVGEVRIYTRTAGGTWAYQTNINGGTAGPNQSGYYGWSVAINYDGTLIAGGSYNNIASGGGTSPGAVYIHTRTAGGSTWTRRETLLASDGSGSDHFGASLCINYDGSTLAVGAPYKDSGNYTDVGAIYTFDQIIVTGTTFAEQTRVQASDATGGDRFGNSVSINNDGTVLAIGAYLDDNSGGGAAGSVYIFTRTAGGTWAQQIRVQASDAATNDFFGYYVSMNSNGTVLAIGAYRDDLVTPAATNAGSVYIFTRTAGGTWAQQTRLQASDASASDEFGSSLSMNSDGTILAIGAPLDDIGTATNAGSVYIFTRTAGGTWSQQTRLQASDASTSDNFGTSVSINNNGTVLAIGADSVDIGAAANAGAVYVFTCTPGGTWAQQTRLQASDATGGDSFGTSLSINTDGTVLAIGAYLDNNSGGTDAGSAYVFTRTAGGTWAEQTRLQGSDSTATDRFGWSISINSDGTTIALGATYDDTSAGSNAGSVYIFTRTAGGTWAEQTRVQASDTSSSDNFGYSVSMNNDGTVIAIGSWRDDIGALTDAGSVYVFTRTASGTNYTQYAAQYGFVSAAGSLFGHSVCVNMDGTIMAIGSYKEDNGTLADAGKVYVFTRTAQGSWTMTNVLVTNDNAASDQFGYSITMDNFGLTLAVGSIVDDNSGGTDTGSVYIFTRTVAGTWVQQTRIQASDAAASDYFGSAVALNYDGTVLAVGGYADDTTGGTDAGSAYVFTRTAGGAWAQQTRIQASDGTASDQFGFAIALNYNGTVLAVGAPLNDNTGGTNAGSTYIFTRTDGGTWAEQTRLQASDAAGSDQFGYTVSVNYDGTVLAIGANIDDNSGGTDAGSVYIFTRTAGGTWAEQTRLQGSDTTASDYFGTSVYLNDTGTTLAVGAVGNTNTGATDGGSVYVFTRTAGGTWAQQTKLFASDVASGDDFGVALALSANGTTLVIGADLEDGALGIDAGTAYVFDQGSIVGMTYSEQTRLQASDAAGSDEFGYAVSINGDGTTLAIGAPYDNVGAIADAGSVYIFTRIVGGTWAQQTRIQASDASASDTFGYSVSINSDGTTLVVGATYDDNSGGGNAGSVYIFTRTAGGTWAQQTRLQASDAAAKDQFGNYVSINSDGTIIAIGAFLQDNPGVTDAGSVYIFTRTSGGTWSEQTRLQTSDHGVNDRFGYSVSINSNGTTMAAGAYYDNNSGGTDAGSVYVFTRTSGGTWAEQTRLQASDATANDQFGSTVSINRDGTILAVGANLDDIGTATNAGSVYIFTRTIGGTWAQQTRIQASDASTSDNFGNAVSINSDGTILVVGSYFDSTSGGSQAGSVYIFTRTVGGTWAQQTRVQASDGATSDRFGNAVSINSDGTTVAIGAYLDNNSGGTDVGSVYIFTSTVVRT